VPHDVRERLVASLGGTAAGTSAQVRAATQHAFVDALGTGLTIAAVVLLLAALAAWLMVSPGRPDAEVPVVAEASVDASPAPVGTVA
jgi:hypothetical protein